MLDTSNKIILVTGGARSGKSSYAQQLASRIGKKILFCATAQPLDNEMKARIEVHRNSRPAGWDTLEANLRIGDSIKKAGEGYDTIIIDCITLLVANCFSGDDPAVWIARALEEIADLTDLLILRQSNYIIVSNEVGNGIVPDNRIGREYRDTLGRANQMLASCADQVFLMVAGLPLKIK